MSSKKSFHIIPAQQEHDTKSLNCRCGVTIWRECTNCEGGGCFICIRGWVEITHKEALSYTEPLHIVHRDFNDFQKTPHY